MRFAVADTDACATLAYQDASCGPTRARPAPAGKRQLLLTDDNYHPGDRQRIAGLLGAEGYVRRFEALSQWDDWYMPA